LLLLRRASVKTYERKNTDEYYMPADIARYEMRRRYNKRAMPMPLFDIITRFFD